MRPAHRLRIQWLVDDQPGFDPKFDLDSSGDVGFTDFIQFAQAFGKSM